MALVLRKGPQSYNGQHGSGATGLADGGAGFERLGRTPPAQHPPGQMADGDDGRRLRRIP